MYTPPSESRKPRWVSLFHVSLKMLNFLRIPPSFFLIMTRCKKITGTVVILDRWKMKRIKKKKREKQERKDKRTYDKRSSKQSRHMYIWVHIFAIHNRVFDNHVLLHNGNIMQVYTIYIVNSYYMPDKRIWIYARCSLYNPDVSLFVSCILATRNTSISRKILQSVGIKTRLHSYKYTRA